VKSRHILLVEDDKDYAALTAGMLRKAGFRVTSIEGARAALAVLQDGVLSVDLVVTDVMMGYLSEGFDFARGLRQHPATRDLPIVILTGMRQIYDVESEIGEGWYPCDAFLEKPVDPDELVRTIFSLLTPEVPRVS
jgi:CheY-like chemotaxis protein